MADRFDSPVDVATELPATALPGLAQMAVAVGIAAFGLLLLNAHALAGWAGALEPGPRTAPIVNAADHLAEQTAARGLDRPRAALKSFWDDVKAARWPHEALPQDQRKKL
jgi:hypothetical protein